MTVHRCDGSDPEMISRYGEPRCPCGATTDDEVQSCWWPHGVLPKVRDVEDAVPDLPSCYRVPAGLIMHGPGCACGNAA